MKSIRNDDMMCANETKLNIAMAKKAFKRRKISVIG